MPIYQTSTYAHDALGTNKGFSYSRTANPSRLALERCVASLEGAAHGIAFASGMAAIDAVFRQLAPADHIILPAAGYGGTYKLITQVLSNPFTTVDQTDLAAVAAAFRHGTRMVWVESPTNPCLDVVDIAAVAELAHDHGAWCVVDNTFATPYLQRPLELGADVVVHSATKYLGGHSDLIGGLAVTDDAELAAGITLVQHAAGAVPGPMDCFLVLRGLKTLAVRMDRHCANAAKMAEFLVAHQAVGHVSYPGLADGRGHDLAKRQMSAFGGMVSFTLVAGEGATRRFVDSCRLFILGESLGGVESLVGYPAQMSHAVMERTPLAIDPALVRLSVGLEDPEDLLRDLAQALNCL